MTSVSGRVTPRAVVVGHVAAGVVVAVGVAAQIARPLAPEYPVPEAASVFDAQQLARAEAYRAPLRWAGLASMAVRAGVPLLVVLTPVGRRAIEAVGRRTGGRRRPALTAAAVAVGVGMAVELLRLPLSFWVGFVHEGDWGFRTQGLGGWVSDLLRNWLIGSAAVAVLASGAVLLVRRLPRAWMPVGALLAAGASVLLIFVAPRVLEPLEFRLTPLPEGPVRAEVQRVLAAAEIEVSEILVADASRRTTKQNAYVSGLGATRRVVLYDTLVEGQTPEQIGLILAHELGHDGNGDIERNALFAAAGAVAGTYALGGLMWLRRRRGLVAGTSPRAVAVAVVAVLLVDLASIPVQTWLSRRAEAAADHAALELTSQPEVFVAAQEELALANLADPAPPRWAYLLWWTHPSTMERIGMGLGWVDEPTP